MSLKISIQYILIFVISLILFGCNDSSLSQNSKTPKVSMDNNIGLSKISSQSENLNKISVSYREKIAGLYVAYFNRAPDQKGLNNWDNRAKNSTDSSNILKELSAGFAEHPTFIATYGNLNNKTFVEKIYKNCLGKAGDKEGIDLWTNYLNSGNSRSDMVSDFVEASLDVILTKENFPNLTNEELAIAQERQDLLSNKVKVGLKFIDLLKTKTNVSNSSDLENDPAYKASIKIIKNITADKSTVSKTIDFLNSIKDDSDPIDKINNPVARKGYLIDSPIVGVTYICGDIKGVTDSDGMFECKETPITFKIGNLTLGVLTEFTADGKVYPQDLLGINRKSFSNDRLKLLTRFLQSIDDDGIIDKSITIDESIGKANVFEKEQSFQSLSEGEVIGLLRGVNNRTLVKECGALKHLGDKLVKCNSDGSYYVAPPPKNNPTPRSNLYLYIPNDKKLTDDMAIRFLNKATFGANKESLKELKKLGVVAWVDKQLSLSLTKDNYLIKTIKFAKQANPEHNPNTVKEYLADNDIVFNKKYASFHSPRFMQSAWFDIAMTSKDQLRQKLTYALSQIIVESDFEPIFTRRGEALSRYFDILQHNAFKTYKQLLTEISFNSGMSMFLTYNGNKALHQNKAGVAIYPDENYAREIMQLFSIGLNELNIDGTPRKESNGNLIPTYTQDDVNELSRVFTGWDIKRNSRFGLVGFTRGDLTHPIEFTEKYHDFGEKKVLGETIPANLSGEEDIKKAIDIIMNNPNVAPFISKNLIIRLTKSNPSPKYIGRVATVFKDSGGDLKEVVKAILLDEEIWDDIKNLKSVKLKEPLIALTSTFRRLEIEPLPYWYFCGYGGPVDDTASNCQKVYNQFLFNNPTNYLGQGAGRAPTVFNFYDNDFVPNDSEFKESSEVAPEAQIQNDTVLIKFNNVVRTIFNWEKVRMLAGSNKTIYDVLENAPKNHNIPIYYIGADKYYFSLKEDYDFLEYHIDGDTNGDFEKLKDDWQKGDIDKINKAVKEYISFVDTKLLGGLLSDDEKEVIYKELTKNEKGFYNHWAGDDTPKAKIRQIMDRVIKPLYRMIISSDKFMTE